MAWGYQLSLVFYEVLFHFGGLCSFSCAVYYHPRSQWVTPAHHGSVIEMRYRFSLDNRFSMGLHTRMGGNFNCLLNSGKIPIVIIKNIFMKCLVWRGYYIQSLLLMTNIISWTQSSVFLMINNLYSHCFL